VRTVVLCGGKGTRALPSTASVPKPLLEVGDRPLLRHVLDVFAAQGRTDFVLAAGYRADMVEDFASTLPASWQVEVHDTGADTGTGGRVHRVRDVVGDRFLCTYGDGLADVDLDALVAFHDAHGRAATVTTVPLRSPYGTVDADAEGRVVRFAEKPVLAEHRVNGGFFVFERRALDAWAGDDLEREVLPALAERGELHAFRHDGFWRSADTFKEIQELAALCCDGPAPWLGIRGRGTGRSDAAP
jgi:glucose-1-phosphate cytidylyltransferase